MIGRNREGEYTMGLKKIQVKLQKNKVWVHFCYIPSHYIDMLSTKDPRDITHFIKVWADLDFNVVLNKKEDVAILKNKIKTYYKNKYPEIYMDSNIDDQGWSRVWVIDHVKEMCGGMYDSNVNSTISNT